MYVVFFTPFKKKKKKKTLSFAPKLSYYFFNFVLFPDFPFAAAL